MKVSALYPHMCCPAIKKKSNKSNWQKHTESGVLFLHDPMDPLDKGQGNKSELTERIHSEKLERSL